MMNIQIEKRLFHHEDILEDKTVRALAYKDLTDWDDLQNRHKGINGLPLSISKKEFLKAISFTGNYFALYELESPKVILFKWPNGELRYFLITKANNLIEASDSSPWDFCFPFIKNNGGNGILIDLSMAAFENVENEDWIWLPNSRNYTHFLVDFYSPVLSMMANFKAEEKNASYKCPQFMSCNWHLEFLDILKGFASNISFDFQYPHQKKSLIESNKNKATLHVFRPSKLLVPFIPNPSCSVNQLKTLIPQTISSADKLDSKSSSIDTKSRILFLTRNDERRARIQNIDEIELFVKKRGGVSVDPAKLNLKQKQNIMSRFDVIIGESSGCLNFALFAAKHSRLISLVDPTGIKDDLFLTGGWSHVIGHSYLTDWIVGTNCKPLQNSPVGSSYYSLESINDYIEKHRINVTEIG